MCIVSLQQKVLEKNAKASFECSAQVVEYLGTILSITPKIAISNHRLRAISDQKVSFYYKDYKHGSVTKTMTLEADEFLRRFCMHILPPKFVKMRHYGFLGLMDKK